MFRAALSTDHAPARLHTWLEGGSEQVQWQGMGLSSHGKKEKSLTRREQVRVKVHLG